MSVATISNQFRAVSRLNQQRPDNTVPSPSEKHGRRVLYKYKITRLLRGCFCRGRPNFGGGQMFVLFKIQMESRTNSALALKNAGKISEILSTNRFSEGSEKNS
jgi:hypothetical protein